MNPLSYVLIFFLSFLPACATGTHDETRTVRQQEDDVPLKDLAEARSIRIGTSVSAEQIKSDRDYAKLIGRELNSITPENEMKFKWTEPRHSEFSFAQADEIMEFAKEHDISVRGHNLAWCRDLPTWLKDGEFTPKQVEEILRDHIKAVVGHFKEKYPGRILAWDVVNEAFTKDGSSKKCIWSRVGTSPTSYIELAFKWAHEADPFAKLYYNEYGAEGNGPKYEAVYELVRSLKSKGVPIDGVGFQMHLGERDEKLSFDEFRENIKRLEKLNVEISITEINYALRDTPSSPDQTIDQASFFENALLSCVQNTGCRNFTMWAFSDKYSRIPQFANGQGRATPFDANLKAKPAYFAMKAALRK